MTLALLVIVPTLIGLVTLYIENVRVAVALLLVNATAHLVVTALLWAGLPGQELSSFLKLDVPGLLFLSITSVLFFVTSLYTVSYIVDGTHDRQAYPRRFIPCLLWFLAAMTLVTVTHHLAVMWAAVEATTLASAPLVYFYKRRGALEAAWKYLLICSVGIALALLGVFFLGIAASASPEGNTSLTLAELIRAAPFMPRNWLKAAFVLALVGYGTKMGLAPLHTWLPDTHSQAPSPVSALLSGALLNCALLAILRFYQVCLASGDAQFARTLFVVFGLISIGVACAFMVRQRDYKRLFAYSSIENMGVIAVGFGLGGTAVYGAVLHAVNHSLCKAGLFFLAGNVLREFGTTNAREVRGVLNRLPVSGVLMMALFFAVGGTPPFGLFVSELMIFRSAISVLDPWIGVLFLVLLALAFLGMAGVLLPMLQSAPTHDAPRHAGESPLSVLAPLVMAGGVLMLGVYIPPALSNVVRVAAIALGG
jgi:hydrogenase-4 component F